MTRLSTAVLGALLVLLITATTAMAAGPTPKGAAQTARTCFAKYGWSARITDHGQTVNAEAPRTRTSWPYRPWYSVSFYDGGDRTYFNENPIALNRYERRVATYCQRLALSR